MSVDVFDLDDNSTMTPTHISNQINAEHRVQLLYFAVEKLSYHALINGVSRLLSIQINNRIQYICKDCLHGCLSQGVLDRHIEKRQLHAAQQVKAPEPEKKQLFFITSEYQLRLPIVIYGHFESIHLRHQTFKKQFDRL